MPPQGWSMPISSCMTLVVTAILRPAIGPEPRQPQRAQRLLRRIGLVEVPGRDRLGQVLVAGACAVGLVEEAGGFGG